MPASGLELPAGTVHGATVGPSGVHCLEAHLPARSLGGEPRPPRARLVVGAHSPSELDRILGARDVLDMKLEYLLDEVGRCHTAA